MARDKALDYLMKDVEELKRQIKDTDYRILKTWGAFKKLETRLIWLIEKRNKQNGTK